MSKVAASCEKEVYSRWQCLKSMPPDVEALEKLRSELMVRRLSATPRTAGRRQLPINVIRLLSRCAGYPVVLSREILTSTNVYTRVE